MAKKASVVPAITPQITLPSALVLNVMVRDRSPVPAPIAHRPMAMMIKRPDSSTQVSSTLIFTLSPTPRKFTAAITAMKTSPTMVTPRVPRPRPSEPEKFAANAREAVDAEVMPEHITAKAMRKVMKWMPKARWA